MSLDLNKLANKLDEALIKETTESLTKFLNDKRMENNKQQTAVEWFHQKTWALKIQLELGEISIGEYASTYATLYEQAKEMEKKQTNKVAGDWWNEGACYVSGGERKYKSFEHYYNETYGGNK